MSWLKELWERLFHWSNITHIANANESDVWICFESNSVEFDKINIALPIGEVERNRPIDLTLNKVSNRGWVKVRSRKFHRYNRVSKAEKVTIVRATTLKEAIEASNNITSDVLLLNYGVQQNFSYIVTKDGEFLRQKYGSNNFFQDFSGWCHLREQKVLPNPDTSHIYAYVYLSGLLGTVLCFCVLRHRIIGSSFFKSVQQKMKLT